MTGPDSRSITQMPGIDEREAAKLRRVGIVTVDDLWAHAGDHAGRREVSAATGIASQRLARWARRAELMQVPSIGPRQAALLELSGVTSLKQLRQRNPESLLESMAEANRTHRLLDHLPDPELASEWVRSADRIAV